MTEHKKLVCETCKKEIPASVAMTAEGGDYIHHFCCPNCMDHFFQKHPELKPPKQ